MNNMQSRQTVIETEMTTKPSVTPIASGVWQRACAYGKHAESSNGECEECKNNRRGFIQRYAISSTSVNDVLPIVYETYRSPGQPLDAQTRTFMETRFGHDFSNVGVHTDAMAAESAQAVNALAYTVGWDVVFGKGQYSPQTDQGMYLLAHELTHDAQQGSATAASKPSAIGSSNSNYEQEADAMASAVANLGEPLPYISHSSPAVQRQADMGEVRASVARREAETRLPARFPDRGIRVICGGRQDLARILGECTAHIVSIASDGILRIEQGPVRPVARLSQAARTNLEQIVNQEPRIIIDTNPNAPGVEVGVFGMETPGYQQIDVANIQALLAASGTGGLTACDSILHEMAEAAAARRALQRNPGFTGRPQYERAHGEGMRVEDAIRSELGLPLRSRTDQGSLVQLGQEGNHRIFLETLIFGSGPNRRTQIVVLRCQLIRTGNNPNGTPSYSCDSEVVASTTVDGLVEFNNQAEALRVFNRYASNLGLRPIQPPAQQKGKP